MIKNFNDFIKSSKYEQFFYKWNINDCTIEPRDTNDCTLEHQIFKIVTYYKVTHRNSYGVNNRGCFCLSSSERSCVIFNYFLNRLSHDIPEYSGFKGFISNFFLFFMNFFSYCINFFVLMFKLTINNCLVCCSVPPAESRC